jgi:hypothetical protein
MAYYPNWMPSSRTEILTMCRNWINIMSTAEVRTAWGIPADQFQELGTLYGAAQALLQKAQDEDTRTHVITVECQAAFKVLEAKMRYFRDRFFKLPPLSKGDWAALGFREKDPHPTPTGTPTAEVTAEPFLVGHHELGVRLVYVSGSPNDKANKGCRIWYKVVPPGGEPVTDPKDLTESFSTRRLKDVIQFDYTDSGKTAYIAVQVENGKKKGPWGPIVSAVIP